MSPEEALSRRVLSAIALIGGGSLANVDAIKKTLRDVSTEEVRRGAHRLVALGYIKPRHYQAALIGTLVAYELTIDGNAELMKDVTVC